MILTTKDIGLFLQCPRLFYKWGTQIQEPAPGPVWDTLIFCLGKTLETGQRIDWRVVTRYIMRKKVPGFSRNTKTLNDRAILAYYKPFRAAFNFYLDILDNIQSVVAVNFPYSVDIDNGNILTGTLPAVLAAKTGFRLLAPYEQDHHHSLTLRAMGCASKRLIGSLPERIDTFGIGSEQQVIGKKIFPTKEYIDESTKILVDVASTMRRNPKYYNPSHCAICSHNKECRLDA